MLFVKVSSASSTPLSARYANWLESKSGETSHKSCFRIFFWIQWISVDVRATGCKSLSSLGLLFLGTGTIRDFFHRQGTMPVSIDSWNSVCAHRSAHIFNLLLLIPSGPLALLGFTCLKWYLTSSIEMSMSTHFIPLISLWTKSCSATKSCMSNLQ